MDPSLCQALKRHARDRAILAGFFPESLGPSTDDRVDVAWCEEIERRMHTLDQGTVEAGKQARW